MMYLKGWNQEARWEILGKEDKGHGFEKVKSGALLSFVFICLMIGLQGGGIGVLEEGYVGLLIFYRKGGE